MRKGSTIAGVVLAAVSLGVMAPAVATPPSWFLHGAGAERSPAADGVRVAWAEDGEIWTSFEGGAAVDTGLAGLPGDIDGDVLVYERRGDVFAHDLASDQPVDLPAPVQTGRKEMSPRLDGGGLWFARRRPLRPDLILHADLSTGEITRVASAARVGLGDVTDGRAGWFTCEGDVCETTLTMNGSEARTLEGRRAGVFDPSGNYYFVIADGGYWGKASVVHRLGPDDTDTVISYIPAGQGVGQLAVLAQEGGGYALLYEETPITDVNPGTIWNIGMVEDADTTPDPGMGYPEWTREWNPVADDAWTAWAQSDVVDPYHWRVWAQNGDGDPMQIGDPALQAWSGGIDAGRLAYVRGQYDPDDPYENQDTNLALYDLASASPIPLPAAVNTGMVEDSVTLSGDLLLFKRMNTDIRATEIHLFDLETEEDRILTTVPNRKAGISMWTEPGRVAGDWVTWFVCRGSWCDTFRYQISTDTRIRVHNGDDDSDWPVTVSEDGTMYFVRGGAASSDQIGIIRRDPDGTETVIVPEAYAWPLYADDQEDGSTDLLFSGTAPGYPDEEQQIIRIEGVDSL